MEWKNYFSCVLKGVIGALASVVILTAILALSMMFIDISGAVFNVIYVVITAVSVIFGTIIAVKLHGEKGWLVGIAVGIIFYIALYLIGVISGAKATFGLYQFIKFGLCVLVGFLSGMLGINLGRN